MQQTMCNLCKQFLSDFLETGVHKDLPLANHVKIQRLRSVLQDLVDWMYRFYQKLPKEEFDKALITSARIARRDRKLLEYEYLIQTATFNFLKHDVSWVSREVNYIQPLLLESGFIKSYKKQGSLSKAYDYVSYITPRVILVLQDLHDDHRNPKGLYTDLSKLYRKPIHHDTDETCADQDDYMSEILNEEDDLYT